jgi:hypothetical protein
LPRMTFPYQVYAGTDLSRNGIYREKFPEFGGDRIDLDIQPPYTERGGNNRNHEREGRTMGKVNGATVAAAAGTAKWLADATPEGLAVGSALLSINEQVYWVKLVEDGAAVVLEALGSGKAYRVVPGRSCSCPDSTYRRPGMCKHSKALAAALPRVKGGAA